MPRLAARCSLLPCFVRLMFPPRPLRVSCAGPGGYDFMDFTRFGFPLQSVLLVVTVFLAHAMYGSEGLLKV